MALVDRSRREESRSDQTAAALLLPGSTGYLDAFVILLRGLVMVRNARVFWFALAFAAAPVVLASTAVVPAFAEKEQKKNVSSSGTAKGGNSAGTAVDTGARNTGVGPRVSDPNPKKKLEKPDSSVAKGRERACGNDQNKCGSLWQEMTNPHDASIPARNKVEKAYRDCMVKCTTAPNQRM